MSVLADRLQTGRRKQVSFRLDPVVLAQVRAALVPLGVSTTTLIERLLLDFARNNKTPSDAAVTLSRLPRPDRL